MSLGRPTKYKPEYCKEAEDFLAQGYTVRSCAAHLDVHHDTLYEWMKQHVDFSDAIKRGQNKSLKYLEDKLKKLIDGERQNKPDTTALIFALKTRFHEVYGDRQKIEQNIESGKIEVHIREKDTKL